MARSLRKETRVENAKERAEAAAARTPQEQLERLDRMFGEGQGAVKERAKLHRKIEALNKAPSKKSEEKAED